MVRERNASTLCVPRPMGKYKRAKKKAVSVETFRFSVLRGKENRSGDRDVVEGKAEGEVAESNRSTILLASAPLRSHCENLRPLSEGSRSSQLRLAAEFSRRNFSGVPDVTK